VKTVIGSRGKLRLDPDLLDRARVIWETAGYSDVSEWVTHLIEKELRVVEEAKDEAELKRRLRGLGYLS
jgi:hypothetical protein